MTNKIMKWFHKMDKEIGAKKGQSITVFLWTGAIANVITYVSGNYFDGKLITWFNFGIELYNKIAIELIGITQSNWTTVVGFITNAFVYGLIGLAIFQIYKKVMK